MGGLLRGVLIAVVVALSAPAAAWANVEVVVELDRPGLAQSRAQSRALTAAARAARLEFGSPASVANLRSLAATQAAFERRLYAAVPEARVYRRYRVVLNALAVSVPKEALQRVERLTGVREVYPATTYFRRLDRSAPMVGAPTYWSFPGVQAGAGMKIAVLDDGIDQTHPFFSASGYAMPPGFPKGQTTHTTAKVIVARAFVPAGITWPAARVPFDSQL